MLDDLDAADEIRRATGQLLQRAEARGRLPTPVEDILAAAELSEPVDSVLAPDSIDRSPSHLRNRLRSATRKIQALLDRRTREVHVNPAIEHAGKERFGRLHEAAHEVFSWHPRDEPFLDDDLTLSPSVRQLFEREANQGAAELLFQGDYFTGVAAEYAVGFGAITELAQRFGASIHATFRRYVEVSETAIAGLVLDHDPCGREPLAFRRREAVASARWCERFEHPRIWPYVLREDAFGFVREVRAACGLGNPRGSWMWPDRNQEAVGLEVEGFSNRYSAFSLVWVPRRQTLRRRRVAVPDYA